MAVAPPGTEKLYRYPYDMIDKGMDYFQIEVVKYEPNKGGFNATAADKDKVAGFDALSGEKFDSEEYKQNMSQRLFGDDADDSLATANVKQGHEEWGNEEKHPADKVIILPIPQNIQDNNGVTWGEDKLNDFAAWGLTRIGDAMNQDNIWGDNSMLGSLGNTMKQLGDTKNGTRGRQIIEYFKLTAAAAAANALGANVSIGSLLSRTTGQVINQNVEMLFSGVQVRSFNFQWDLAPRNIDETETIKSIIRILKQRSAAKMTKSNLGFLNAPDVFRLKYMKGGESHPFLNSFKISALKNMTMNYTGSGTYATYEDGTPVHMQLGLTFSELNPIYAEDHDSATVSGVGY